MLTKITIKNFKRLDYAEIELGRSVVFIGPNNSGKTSALQAIALWGIGIQAWLEKRGNGENVLKRPGVTINRKDLIPIPIPRAELLWKDLHTREGVRNNKEGKPATNNIRIDVAAEGVNLGKLWKCGLEFDYANPESLYCRPLRTGPEGKEKMPVPGNDVMQGIKVAFLPPMSGLASIEPMAQPGRINVLIGEGQTAQVLRNLCFNVYRNAPESSWVKITEHIKKLFGVELLPPEYIEARGEVMMQYKEKELSLDLSSSGRGLQQALLLLAYLYSNENTVVLLDEPDAHLEMLRQRQIYELISSVASEKNCQVIAASHSEIILREAAEKDIVIAFLGKPHRINDKGQQLIKSLNEIVFEDYYLAEETGWVLYLEGSTDLRILKRFAGKLKHKASEHLEKPFVKLLGCNRPDEARKHFMALKEAYPKLKGLAIFDRIDKPIQDQKGLRETMWRRREIENYFCTKEALMQYASGESNSEDLFVRAESKKRASIMAKCISDLEKAQETKRSPSPWSEDIKITDEFLTPLFENFFHALELPNTLNKGDYCNLLDFIEKESLDSEIAEKLDLVSSIAGENENL